MATSFEIQKKLCEAQRRMRELQRELDRLEAEDARDRQAERQKFLDAMSQDYKQQFPHCCNFIGY